MSNTTPYTIFYSWQSDLSDSKRFIQSTLDKLEKKLKNSGDVCVTIDRDTIGVPGAPNIPATIWRKIEEADLFVADVSIINSTSEGRKTPNPNVLLETGYAIHALGWDRVVLLFDEDYGSNDDEPFDLKQHRLTGFSLKDDKAKEKSRERIIANISYNLKLLETKEKQTKQGSRQLLASVIMHAMEKAWEYYEKAFLQDHPLDSSELIPITETQIALLEEVRDSLDEGDYFAFHRLLNNLKMATTGTEDMDGHEFIQRIVKQYIEPLYCEYYSKIQKLSLPEILTDKFVNLFNNLASEKQKLSYQEERFFNGKLVMKIAGNYGEVYSEDEELLYKAEKDLNGQITGYRSGYEYSGEYVEGRREGKGEEYFRGFDSFSCQGLNGEEECNGAVKQEGIWKAGKLIEGTLYGVVLYKEDDGSFVILDGYGEEELQFMDDEYLKYHINEERPTECKRYYAGTLELKDGIYELDDNSVKPLCSEIGGVRNFICWECEQ